MIKHHKQFIWFGILVVLLVGALIAVFLTYRSQQQQTTISLSCTNYALDQCPSPSCIVCPPCPECSSLSCQTAAKCKSMGIDARWYQSLKNQQAN